MRRALYGVVGLMVGVITYIFLIISSPVIANVDSGITNFQNQDDYHMKEDLRDVKGDVTSFLESGSYHLSTNEYQSLSPSVVKYGKVNPMFYYIHKIKSEEDEDESESDEPALSSATNVEDDVSGMSEPNTGGNPVSLVKSTSNEGFNKEKGVFESIDMSSAMKHFSKFGTMPIDEKYYQISSSFGKREDPFSNQKAIHSGLDIAAPEILGKNIYAASHGRILEVANSPESYGQYVVVEHDGYNTLYGHLSSFADIKEGDIISAGSPVGQVGSTGRSTGPHLHFEIMIGDVAVDPVPFINEIRKDD